MKFSKLIKIYRQMDFKIYVLSFLKKSDAEFDILMCIGMGSIVMAQPPKRLHRHSCKHRNCLKCHSVVLSTYFMSLNFFDNMSCANKTLVYVCEEQNKKIYAPW